MEVKFTTEFLEKEFRKFNRLYFKNKLPMVDLYWNSMKPYGQCAWNFNCIKQEVTTTYIRLNPDKLNDYDEFRNTFVHEMCHLYHNLTITHKKILEANKVGPALSRKWHNYLSWGTDTLSHEGVWREKAEELNSKFKELHILRIGGGTSLKNRTATGRIKKAAVRELEGKHAVLITGYKTMFTFIDTKELNKAKKADYVSEIYEFQYDPVKAAEYGLKVCPVYTRGYKSKYFNYLCKEGVIKKYTKKQIK